MAGRQRAGRDSLNQPRRRFLRPLVEQLERRELLAGVPVMLGDLNPAGGSSVVNDSVVGHRVVEMDGLYYFAATTPATGLELWRTDGTPQNTEIVTDLVPGAGDGVAPAKSLWKGPDGNLYFVGANPSLGLMRLRPDSNTPEHVTSFNIPDLNPFPNQGAVLNGELYYPAQVSNQFGQPVGIELAKFNFTTGQATLVADVNIGSLPSFPSSLTVAGDTLYFLAESGFDNIPELWSYHESDGLVQVTNLSPASNQILKLVAAEDRLYVLGDRQFDNDQLWVVEQGYAFAQLLLERPTLHHHTMQALGNDLMFTTWDINYDYQIWRTEDASGIWAVPLVQYIENIADQRGVAHVMDGVYYLFAQGDTYGADWNKLFLWSSDGTTAGTSPVALIDTNVLTSGFDMTSTSGQLYFLAHHRTHGFGLWASDGSSAGTQFVMPTTAGTQASALLPPVAVNGSVFFAADNGVNGRETWAIIGEPPPSPPDLVASGLQILSSGEVQWGETFQIAFDVTSRQGPVDGFKVLVYLSGDPVINTAPGSGDYALDLYSYEVGLAADESTTVQMFLHLPPFVPPPSFQVTGRLYVGLQVDPLDEHVETDETNNVNQGLGVDTILARDVPELLHVVTHGIDPNFDVSTGFNGRWQWDYPRKLWDLAASTSLAGKTGTYSNIWNSSAGWTRALLDIVAQAWLKTPDAVELPPEALAELQRYSEADLQLALERAVREVEFTAHKIVQELHARGDLIGPAARQRIHLIGMGSGAAVNARVAQLLTDRGYTITLFSSLDGLGTDWPGAAADLTDVSLNNVPASRRINYRVQAALEDPLVPSGTTSGIEQLASKLLAKLLGRAIDPELIPDAFSEWRAPMRSSQFENVNLAGPSPDAPTNHFNIADRYFNHGPAASDLAWLATEPRPLPRTAVPSAGSPLLDDFIDGSFERIPAIAAMIDSLAPFAAADEFTKAWLEAVNLYNPLLANDWFTFNDATIAPHGNGHALRLTQVPFASTTARQSVIVPPNALLTFSLEAFGTLDSTDSVVVYFETGGIFSAVYAGRLVDAGVVGPKAISLSAIAGKAGTLMFSLNGSVSHVNTVMIDDAQIRVGGHIASASAQLLAGSDSVVLEARDIIALPGGIDEVRYYVESNGLIGLQIGSDRQLGLGTNPADNWRLESSAYGLKYGYERLYAVAWKGGTSGPERSIDLFLAPPAEHPYHRASNPLDVDGDGEIWPIDALIVINALNAGLIGDLSIPSYVSLPFDTDANDSLEPLDALLIINHLNALPASPQWLAGEGEAATEESPLAASGETESLYDMALLTLLELDPRDKRSRRH